MRSLLVAFPLFLVACASSAAEPNAEQGRQAAMAERAEETGGGDELTGASEAATGSGAKAETDECEPYGLPRDCGNDSWAECVKGPFGHWVWGQCIYDTPLVLVFDGAPVTFTPSPAETTFDLAGDGASHVTNWPTARTPWLALDRDRNGRIDDGAELFGSMTRLGTGVRANNGFEALAELDSNHDGAITSADERFAELLLWSDADSDRIASAIEQGPASERIVRIDLAYRIDRRCTAGGDCEVERATMVYRAADGTERTGDVVDVHLRRR